MANELDEVTGPIKEEGRDVNVIEKQLPVKVGVGSTVFEVILWVLGIIPGIVFLFMKINAGKYLSQLQQNIQSAASTVDNYMEQRVVELKNAAQLLDKAIDLDKDTMTKIASYRGGMNTAEGDRARNEIAQTMDNVAAKINVAFENYPDLKAHQEIADVLQKNSYLQREITAARELYNDAVNRWNNAIFEWPTKQIVAAKRGYTTRIPFSISKETKEEARGTFFN